LDDYNEVPLTERFRRLRPPQLWKARVPLLPKIAVLVVAQIAVFFLLFWWFSHRSHHNNTPVTTNSGIRNVIFQTK